MPGIRWATSTYGRVDEGGDPLGAIGLGRDQRQAPTDAKPSGPEAVVHLATQITVVGRRVKRQQCVPHIRLASLAYAANLLA